jgi:hypothetical protein
MAPAGACTSMVWLNSAVGPRTSLSHRMIGVATTGPMPSSITPSSSPMPTTRANLPTVCSTKMSRVRQFRPAARARVTTCMEEMLSPPRSKNESSTPTRSTPSTSA